MRVTAAIQGTLTEFVKSEMDAARQANREAIVEAMDGCRTELKAMTAAAGLGNLAKAWGKKVVDRGGMNIRGYVSVKGQRATQAMRSFTEGAIITGKSGNYLAVPLPAAGKRTRSYDPTPLNFERRTGIRLRPVYRPGKPTLLVADNARLSSRGTAKANVGRKQGASFTRLAGRTTVPVFVLMGRVALRKRFDRNTIIAKWQNRYIELVVEKWNQIDAGRNR